MLKWLKSKLKKKKNKPIPTPQEDIKCCQNCVWWAAEEENYKERHKNKNFRFCDIKKIYTPKSYKCDIYTKEKFEADEFSTSTPFLTLDLEQKIEKLEDEVKPKK